ncbi:MAG TPA: SIMPL domain-containing protein [Xanthobacteraceae bacterium]|nr:SIMPL domain-containing protein [Xanthobacteraceae bacterium]
MRSVLFVATCILALCATAEAQERLVPRLTVTGEASVNIAPDMAQIRTGVTSQAKTAREASEANAKAANAVLAALRASGIDDKDIQTTRLVLAPTYDTNPGGRGRITGFQASNQVTIKVREIAKLADVIDRVVAAGATDIGGIEFVVSSPSPALDRARGEAFADARRKADVYAKAAGIRLGRVIGLSEEQSGHEVFPMAARAAGAPPIAPGEKTLRLMVTVSYELPN